MVSLVLLLVLSYAINDNVFIYVLLAIQLVIIKSTTGDLDSYKVHVQSKQCCFNSFQSLRSYFYYLSFLSRNVLSYLCCVYYKLASLVAGKPNFHEGYV